MSEAIKTVGDITATGVIVANVLNWAPLILAIPAAVYACLRIYEWFEKRRKQKR